MIYKRQDSGYREALEGVALKTLAFGEQTLLAGTCPSPLSMSKFFPDM